MSTISFILLLTVSFVFSERANFHTTPHWMSNEYKFTCIPECSKYLKGETYFCTPSSPHGLAAGSFILRLLSDLDWRYYRLYEDRNNQDFCKSILIADQFYESENKTLCRPIPSLRDEMYYNAKRKTDAPLIEKVVRSLEKITRSAEQIQRRAMVVDESADLQENDLQYPAKDYYPNPKSNNSGVNKPSHTYSNDKTDALCFWASKDVCKKKQMVVCVLNVCCWTTLDPDACDTKVSSEDEINRHRQNLFHVLQTMKTY